MTVFNGPSNSKTSGTSQPRNIGIQTSPDVPAPTGVTGVTQTAPKTISQMGGTQTTPPQSTKRTTSTGGKQTTPPHGNVQDLGTQGQLDHNHSNEDQLANSTGTNTGRGKKNKKKSS